MKDTIGIIGAGMAGAWLANQLDAAGHDVVVFEKSRGFGGRMATRRLDDITFDHGAQFFTARTSAFQKVLETHHDIVETWTPNVATLGAVTKPFKRPWFEPHYVGVPSMGALCKRLLGDIPVELNFEVRELQPKDSGWVVLNQDGVQRELGWVISTAPAEQTQNLTRAPLDDVIYTPCFALMAYLEQPPSFDAAVIRGSALDWLAVPSSRPARLATPGIVAHATPEWSIQHYDHDREHVANLLATAVRELGIYVKEIAALHRWRYARVAQPHSEPFWIAAQHRLAACGDWGLGPNVEDAFTSADQLLDTLRRTSTLIGTSKT